MQLNPQKVYKFWFVIFKSLLTSCKILRLISTIWRSTYPWWLTQLSRMESHDKWKHSEQGLTRLYASISLA